MRRPVAVLAVAAAVLTLAGCGASPIAGSPAASSSTVAVPTSITAVAPTTTTDPVTTTEPPVTTPSYNLPPGYPKVVAVRTLPDQVRNWYQLKGDTQAVQLAPGVWTPLPDGASVADAVNSNVADGFCASIKAYAREYLGGEQPGGACW